MSEPSASISKNRANTKWSDHYAGPSDTVELFGDELALETKLRDQHNVRCLFDSHLFEAAKYIAAISPREPLSPRNEDLDLVRFAVLRTGTPDYAVLPIVAKFDEQGLKEFFDLIDKSSSRLTNCGFAVFGDEPNKRVVWIGIQRSLDLEPFPVRARLKDSIHIKGRVLRGQNATIDPYIGYEDGTVARLPAFNAGSGGLFDIEVRLVKSGRSEIELLVDRGHGSEVAVLALVFVDCEPDPMPIVTVDDGQERLSSKPDDVLFGYLKAARKRFGLQPLKRDIEMDRIAEAHSMDMALSGFFGHVSLRNGALNNRLEAANIFPTRSAENVARSNGPLKIHRNLLRSPSHRLHMLDPGFTHVGIGVARDKDELIATEIFACF